MQASQSTKQVRWTPQISSLLSWIPVFCFLFGFCFSQLFAFYVLTSLRFTFLTCNMQSGGYYPTQVLQPLKSVLASLSSAFSWCSLFPYSGLYPSCEMDKQSADTSITSLPLFPPSPLQSFPTLGKLIPVVTGFTDTSSQMGQEASVERANWMKLTSFCQWSGTDGRGRRALQPPNMYGCYTQVTLRDLIGCVD